MADDDADESPGRVILIGDFDYEYPRETNIREGLEHHGVTVDSCQFSDTQRFLGPTKALLMPLFYLRTWRRMRVLLADGPTPDALFVSKFNPLILPLVWMYAKRLGCPLVYDLFVSLSRTAELRGVHPAVVRVVWFVEYVLLRLPDHHTVGTNQFIALYADMYGLPESRFIRLPPGADEAWYYPMPDVERQDTFTALYWGNFLPHHGVDVIVEAARELEDRGRDNIAVVFVGKGPRKEPAEALVERYGLSNTRFEGFVPREDLQYWIASSHVALGVFSEDKRAMASITNKVNEGVAMAKAVITEDSPAIREWFEHRESIYAVPPEDPDALADAIEDCEANPELVSRLEDGAYDVYQAEFTQETIGAILVDALDLDTERRD